MANSQFQGDSVLSQRHADFSSKYLEARNVDVWCPPDYALQPQKRYPVIYMHDGQNLFDPALANTGITWGVAEALTSMIRDGQSEGAIVVGIWHSGTGRWGDYMPQKPLETPAAQEVKAALCTQYGGVPVSDNYLRFVVEELKPFIDQTYRTLPDQPHTSIMGSSMGGLISLYALVQYPEVFGGAGCLSTHWPSGGNLLVDYFGAALLRPGTNKIYFDFGTVGLDSSYEPYQERMDRWLQKAGYTRGQDWVSLKFEGEDHNEQAWRKRINIPLKFLLGS